MLSLDGLGRAYGNKWAVRGLSLSVEEGEILGLLGPNGAGKTTVVRMVAGALAPTEGRVVVCGIDLRECPVEAKLQIGYVPDRAFFYEKLSVREHMVFVSSLYGLPRGEAMERSEELLMDLGLKDVEGLLVEGCSQGMKQRLLFASALVHNPRVLLIDEPFIGLDPFGVTLIKDRIKSLAEGGASVFLATHSLHMASELCSRVALLDGGGLVALKRKEDIDGYEGGLEGLFMRELGNG